MSRLVFATQVIDADHPALAQTIDMVEALAARVDDVVVVCDHVGRHALPENVRLRVFGGPSRIARGARYARVIADEVWRRRDRPDAVLCHMIPVFLTLAAPIVKPSRTPLVLWYTHWNADRSLRLATRLADRVLSVDHRSFPIETPKVRGIGHAIDVAQFAPRPRREHEGPLRLLALGRLTPWKGYTTMLSALQIAGDGLDATLEIRGPTLTDAERAHRRELEGVIAADSSLSGRVRLEEPVARDRVPELLADADVFVSATQPGPTETLDKVVYEAAACGVPVVSSNSALDEFLGGLPVRLRFGARDAGDLAACLVDLAAAGRSTHLEIGTTLRERVVEGHSVGRWADRVLAEIDDLRGKGRRTPGV